MKVAKQKTNQDIPLGMSLFKYVEDKNFKTFGYSSIISDGNVLRIKKAPQIIVHRKRVAKKGIR